MVIQQVVLNISKDHSDFIFRVKHSKKNDLLDGGPCFIQQWHIQRLMYSTYIHPMWKALLQIWIIVIQAEKPIQGGYC